MKNPCSGVRFPYLPSSSIDKMLILINFDYSSPFRSQLFTPQIQHILMGIAIHFVFSRTGNWTWNFTGSKCKAMGLAEDALPAVGACPPQHPRFTNCLQA
jgi:hypothetical protein